MMKVVEDWSPVVVYFTEYGNNDASTVPLQLAADVDCAKATINRATKVVCFITRRVDLKKKACDTKLRAPEAAGQY